MHQSFQNSASGQTAHFFYFLYFPFIVASRLSSANTLSKYAFISSYDSSNSLVLLFTSLRKSSLGNDCLHFKNFPFCVFLCRSKYYGEKNNNNQFQVFLSTPSSTISNTSSMSTNRPSLYLNHQRPTR